MQSRWTPLPVYSSSSSSWRPPTAAGTTMSGTSPALVGGTAAVSATAAGSATTTFTLDQSSLLLPPLLPSLAAPDLSQEQKSNQKRARSQSQSWSRSRTLTQTLGVSHPEIDDKTNRNSAPARPRAATTTSFTTTTTTTTTTPHKTIATRLSRLAQPRTATSPLRLHGAMIRRPSQSESPQKASLDSLGVPISLSRKSSRRSTGSNTANNNNNMSASASSRGDKDRPESVTMFAKTLFGRRSKLQREDSSSSSSFSDEIQPIAGPMAGNMVDGRFTPPLMPPNQVSVFEKDKETFSMPSMPSMPSILKRRKGKPESARSSHEESRPARRFQISEPYNFQHVTHTCRDEMGSDSNTAYRHDNLFCGDVAFDADRFTMMEQASAVGSSFLAVPDQFGQRSRSGSVHTINHCQSSEHMRPSPVRPPRPSRPYIEACPAPMPPPRTSSRQSSHRTEDSVGGGAMLAPPSSTAYMLRPQTSGAIVCHQPFTLDPERLIPPPISGAVAVPAPLVEKRERRPTITRASPQPTDAPAWPLPNTADIKVAVTDTSKADSGLAGVVEEDEEDEEKERRRRSRQSIRASRSVPMLRNIIQTHQPDAMPHNASQTLGRHDLLAAQRALKSFLPHDSSEPLFMDDENWEDDIDYCYEHDANADFEYEWSRPSVDLSRAFGSFVPVHEIDRTIAFLGTPKLNTDVPALSPASQVSGNDSSEAATPTGPTSRSLDLARPDLVPAGLGLQPNRFTVDQFEFSHERNDENTLTVNDEAPKTRSRSSTVTTVAYTDDGDSRSVFDDRHISISSNQTSLTRYTSSTGSLKRRASWKRTLEASHGERPSTPMRSPTPTTMGHLSPEPACSPWVSTTILSGRKSADHYRSPGHMSRASESSSPMVREQPKRRPRARTTTGSAPGTPAPAQFSLFPRTSPKNRVV